MPDECILQPEDAATIIRAFLYDWFERIRNEHGPRWNPIKTAIWSRVATSFQNAVAKNDIQVNAVGTAPGGAYYDFRDTTPSGDPWMTWDVLRPVVPGARGRVELPPQTASAGYCSHVFSYDITALPPGTTPTGIITKQGRSIFLAWVFACGGGPLAAALQGAGGGAASAAGISLPGAPGFQDPFANTVFKNGAVRKLAVETGRAKSKLKFRAGDLNVRQIYNQLNQAWQAGTFAAARADSRPQVQAAIRASGTKITTGLARLTYRVLSTTGPDEPVSEAIPLPPFDLGIEVWDGMMLRDWDYSSSYRFVDGLVTPNMVGGEPDWTKLDDLFSQSVGHSAVMQAMTKDGKEKRKGDKK